MSESRRAAGEGLDFRGSNPGLLPRESVASAASEGTLSAPRRIVSLKTGPSHPIGGVHGGIAMGGAGARGQGRTGSIRGHHPESEGRNTGAGAPRLRPTRGLEGVSTLQVGEPQCNAPSDDATSASSFLQRLWGGGGGEGRGAAGDESTPGGSSIRSALWGGSMGSPVAQHEHSARDIRLESPESGGRLARAAEEGISVTSGKGSAA